MERTPCNNFIIEILEILYRNIIEIRRVFLIRSISRIYYAIIVNETLFHESYICT